MKTLKYKLGSLLLNIDDWFARYHIYFDIFTKSKDRDNHVSFLCRWGFALIFDSKIK